MTAEDKAFIESMEHYIKGLGTQIENAQESIRQSLESIEHDKKTQQLAHNRRIAAIDRLAEYKRNIPS